MTNQPLVTVLLPVYNAEKYLSEGIESIINQTYKNLDILLVDDGSTDSSVEIIRSYMKFDHRIRLIENINNRGVSFTRNKGIDNSKGKYIAFMDSDDTSRSDRIELQVAFLEKNTDFIAVASYFKYTGSKQRKIKNFKTSNELAIAMIFKNPIMNSSPIIRRKELIEANIKHNTKYFYGEDYDFWFKVSQLGKIGMISKFLVTYRWGHENTTSLVFSKKNLEKVRIINEIKSSILSFYKISLNQEEKNIINFFFDDEVEFNISKDKYVFLSAINKIKVSLTQYNNFSLTDIDNVWNKYFIRQLARANLTLIEKFDIACKYTNENKVISFFTIFGRHCYKKYVNRKKE
ncbi:glycosyltransferase family 2 protein [Lactococcus lactis subsp. lactis]|uniref:glycosyltransferase family 2 protein n=1 Tax=Lactococcus lactis TaxID=1358 RepID=UPI00223ABB58|nr:glycosyltransferase family A protein [Lactococcus lactis]MCT0035767.1 glycosyltransferase family 2 protein [Lactococcus lactis subsp. lactis]